MTQLVPVILSGGSGTRLWPLSREEYPKHLIPLIDDVTLLQKTIMRVSSVASAAPIVICNHQQRFMVAEQLQQIAMLPELIALEPCGRNTAPAIAIAAQYLADQGRADDWMLVLPADHMIQDEAQFCATVKKACEHIQAGQLITFGTVPHCPHTGYGYIKRGHEIASGIYQVDQFVEKPNSATALDYLSTGQYLWNSGMFLFSANAILQELTQYEPELVQHAQLALSCAQVDLDFVRLDETAFAAMPDIAIDVAVMERSKQVVTLPLDAGWSDVGSWESLAEVMPEDDCHNVIMGDVMLEASSNCFVRAESRLCAVLGVQDQIIVETPDAVLVADKSKTQLVKKIVAQLKHQKRDERLHHRTQYKPWGSHELLIEQSNFQVRRVSVKPGCKIAMQKHQQRSEHWVIITGQADITRGDQVLQLGPNDSLDIPANTVHQIFNNSTQPLVFIEVQLGACIKEDDVERLPEQGARI